MPLGVVTVMSTVPAVPDGAVARMVVADITVKDVAAVEPKVTALALVKLVPVIVTSVPPTVPPLLGLTALTVGLDAALSTKWSALEVEDVPEVVVTVTSTVPAAWAGAVAKSTPSDRNVNAAATLPKDTL